MNSMNYIGLDIHKKSISGLLLSTGSANARKYNPRPEQKLAHHTENTRHEDQLPPARSQPNHMVSPGPSIRPSRLSVKIRKHSIAASW
jgi:hypothetical protein